jgi:hypothetical protein
MFSTVVAFYSLGICCLDADVDELFILFVRILIILINIFYSLLFGL